MTPAARLQGAIEALTDIETRRRPVADALKDWGLSHRFAGSKDRSAIGNIVYDALRWRLSSAYALAIGLIALMTALVAIAPSLWVALPLLVLTGVGNAAALASQRTLIQRGTPDAMRGRAVALLMGLGNAVLVLTMAASGPFTSAFGARAAWLLAAGLMGAATVAAILLGRHVIAAKAPPLEQEPGDPALDAVVPR